ncbi:MAG: ABC transporter substrate-binding protein [Bifidobacterium adolescentis]
MKAEITRWLIFFGVAIMLSVMTWLGWSLTNRKNPITSFTTLVSDSSVAIGIQGSAPESLDIRTEQGHRAGAGAARKRTKPCVTQRNQQTAAPSIAKSWQISDDGLTYTFTLNSNVTFSNGHKLGLVRRALVAAKRHQQQLRGIRPTW